MPTGKERIDALATAVALEFNAVRTEMASGGGGPQHVKLTAAAYNALATKDPNTIYYVTA